MAGAPSGVSLVTTRFTLSKPRRLRTVAALALGFTAIPTAALAVAGDAIPGDPFKLGQENHISDASTTIRGTGQGVASVLQSAP